MKRTGLTLFLLFAGVVPVRADFILFQNAVGDWSVTCWRALLDDK